MELVTELVKFCFVALDWNRTKTSYILNGTFNTPAFDFRKLHRMQPQRTCNAEHM